MDLQRVAGVAGVAHGVARVVLWRRRSSLASLLRLLPVCCGGRRLGDDGFAGLDVNSIVDQVLEKARSQIEARGLDQVALPDMTEKFKKRVGVVRITGKFEARDGWARSLSTLQRTGEATLTEEGDKIVVDVPLGLTDLQIGYSYKATLGKLGPGGRLTATVASNAVHLRASLLLRDDACALGVDSLSLIDLGAIRVRATGLGRLNVLYSKIATWAAARLHDEIEEAVERGLQEAVAKAGLRVNCDTLLDGVV